MMALIGMAQPDDAVRTRMLAEKVAGELFGRVGGPLPQVSSVDISGSQQCISGIQSALAHANSEGAEVPRWTVRCSVDAGALVVEGESSGSTTRVTRILPTYWSVFPPLLAVFLALATRRLIVALGAAVWAGAIIASGLGPTLGLWPAVRDFLWVAVSDQFRLTIVVFASALVGMVNVASRAGGSQGIADAVARLARGAASTRVATALLGMAIFFDDYANCIVVGTTMRPLADRMRISREKLAYLVDSTAAPIAGLAFLSTWIGYEVALFDDLSRDLSLGTGGYDLFLQVLPVRFYCLLTLVFVLLCAFSGRDFGPMARAEKRALALGKVLADDARPLTSRALTNVLPAKGIVPRWYVAAVPVATVIVCTAAGLVLSGSQAEATARWVAQHGASLHDFGYLRQCLQGANGAFVLMVSALCGSAVAWSLALTRPHGRAQDSKAARCRPPLADFVVLGAVPFVVFLGAAIVHSGLSLDGFWFWQAPFWTLFWGRTETRFVVLVGAGISFLFLVLALFRWRLSVHRTRPVTFMLGPRMVFLSWASGARAMVLAIVILVLAWSIQEVCQSLGTSIFLVAALSSWLEPALLPLLVFLLSAAVAFSTGTSWGAMGILTPAVVPLAFHMGGWPLLILSAGAVLDGAIFGDHCSPISDTTVISSVATSCDHVDHVRTQLPYALTTMTVAAMVYLTVTAGMPLWLGYGAGAAAILAIFKWIAKPQSLPAPPS